ncbi:winged helix-turn-helix domain-containing protein [Lysobacter cavernae]|uniref:Winged helix-turn-helix domain-containing protein n=1 Tax=Lysobacter cavernae TaxID=1685901 RepID=A0ABV7RM79_9GAMM
MDPIRMAGQGGPTTESYRFDDIVVDATAHTLSRAGEPQTVEPKAFAVLLLLLRRAGELVGRDELLDTVWGHRHVTPGVLTRVIAQLRHALGDDSQHPRYIQTQHALGYRFIGLPRSEPEPIAPATPDDAETSAEPAAEPVGEIAGAVAVRQSVPPDMTVAANEADTVDEPVGRPAAGAAAVPAAPLSLASADSGQGQRSRRRWSGWIATAVVVVVAAVALVFWWQRQNVPPRPTEASIAVLPFASLSANRDDRYFAEGLGVEMHDALARVPGLKVVASAATGADRTRDPKALGKALGVATVLDASVRREGARVRINARVSDSATGFTLWTQSYDRETADVFALQSEIANEVVQALLGVLPGDGQALAKRLAPTRSIAAYDAYLKGLHQLQEASVEQNLDRAIGFFNQALVADPAFARAQAGICRVEIARFEAARDATAYERARAACLRASSMDPGLREVSLAMGEMYRARGESAKANEQYTKALDDIALQPAAYLGLARMQSAQGHNQLALDYFERARKLRPKDDTIYRALGLHQYTNGDLAKAIESFRVASTLRPDDEVVWSSLGGLYLASGDITRASDAFKRSLEIKPNYRALSNYGTLKYEAGAYAEAAALFRHAAELDPDDYRVWGNIGDALSALPATTAQAAAPYRRAAQMAERYLGIRSDDARALGRLCWYQANLGEAQAARASLAKAEAIDAERGEVALDGAQALVLLGDTEGARQRLRRARAEGIPEQRIVALPLLRRLLATDKPASGDGGV